jgi:hypothetical protein
MMTMRNDPKGRMGTDESLDARPLPRSKPVELGQVWAGRLTDGQKAVIRVQNLGTVMVHVVALSAGLRGREASIPSSAFGTRFRLVSTDPNPKYDQVCAWMKEIR